MKLEINPRVGVGPLTFGLRPQQVRRLINDEFISEMKNKFANHPYDYFTKIGLIAAYDESLQLEAIELADPAQAMLYGVDMLQMGFHQAVTFLKARDPSTAVDTYGGISKRLGVAFWSSLGDEDSGNLIQTVFVFRDGYYDS